MSLDLYIDVLDMALNRYGSGPLTMLRYWESTSRLDQAGTFSFEVSAQDSQTAEVQALRIVRAYAWLDGVWTEIGSGIIERIERAPAADGSVMLRVSGSDMLREFAAHVTNTNFQYSGGVPMTHAQAVNLVRQLPIFDGYTYSLWGGTPDPTPPNDVVQFATNQESCLFTARRVAEISGNHFYLSGFRALTYASTFAESGVRAIQPGTGPLDAETCAILQLMVASDTTEYVSRVYARGGGNGVAEMSMRYTTRSAPAGYTLDKSLGYLQNNTLHAVFPSSRKVLFKDLRPLSNNTADIQAADNALFDSALAWLRSHSETYNAPLYRLSVAQCRLLLRPMQTIRVSYRNPDAGIFLDDNLKILEATIRIDEQGLRTTDLAVRAIDYWPESEGQVVAESVQQSQIYSSAAQPDVNSYALALRGQIDSEDNCTFAFRLGPEITQVQGIYLDFHIVPLEDATTSISSDANTGLGGPASTDAGGTANTDSGGPTTTGTGGPTTTGTGGPTATQNNTTALSTQNNTGNGLATQDNTGALTTEVDGGGGSTVGGIHRHRLPVWAAPAPEGYALYIKSDGTIIAVGAVYNIDAYVDNDLDHQHNIQNHSHVIAAHSHAILAHSHGISPHSHPVTQHSHSVAQHSHSIAQHSHSVAQHSHSVAQHTHPAPALSVTHRPWRESSNTLAANTLAYSINGGAWLAVMTSLGSGWYRIDLTAALLDSALRPLAELNTIEFRTTSQYTGMIEAQLTIRCSIQAVDVD